jgi:tRNA(Ile)-lysidine synthase
MLELFKRHVFQKGILAADKHYLLAISAGLDSVALAYLLKGSGISFALVHCNFGLRGSASDGDELFVRGLAGHFGAEIVVRHFDVESYKQAHGVSTQMAARDLRYAWFQELVVEMRPEAILVAHHADDQLETVLLNLLRGTGLEGVYGMSDRREWLIRPLLPFTRSDLLSFVLANDIKWREDCSNQTSDYKRNFLRNEVLPLLESHFSGSHEALMGSFGRIKDSGQAFFHLLQEWKTKYLIQEGDFTFLDLSSVSQLPGRSSVLYYWLRTYGFNFSQVRELGEAIDEGRVGVQFRAGGYEINLDRSQLILGVEISDFNVFSIDRHDIEFELGDKSYDLLTVPAESADLDRKSNNAMLDKESLHFPLSVRPWREGDRFRPLGMKQFKKVSDFLIDLKVPLIMKQRVRVLCSGEDIVWVIGFRVDDRFKVGAYTRYILYIKEKAKHV